MSELGDAIRVNALAVQRLSEPDLRAILPVLRRARDETAAGLAEFLQQRDGGDTYTVHTHRALLAQLEPAIRTIEHELAPAARRDVTRDAQQASGWAVKHLRAVAEAGEKHFAMATPPLRFDSALVIRDANHVLHTRFASSAARYAGAAGARMRDTLAVSLIRGETIDQMTRRLLAGGDVRLRTLQRRGPEAVAEGVAERQFFRNYADAERLARTELVNAYGEIQVQGLEAANREDPGWLKRWDAANDRKVCPWCWSLNNVTVAPEEPFPEGVDHPPLHPCCRCAVVPWRVEWPAWEQFFKRAA